MHRTVDLTSGKTSRQRRGHGTNAADTRRPDDGRRSRQASAGIAVAFDHASTGHVRITNWLRSDAGSCPRISAGQPAGLPVLALVSARVTARGLSRVAGIAQPRGDVSAQFIYGSCTRTPALLILLGLARYEHALAPAPATRNPAQPAGQLATSGWVPWRRPSGWASPHNVETSP